MDFPPGSEAPAGPSEDALNAALQGLAGAWREGRPAEVEEFLARYPALRNDPEAAVRLIYEEICLRQEAGQVGATSEVIDRFPQFRSDLEVFLECYRLLGPELSEPVFPSVGESLGEFRLLAELGRGTCGRVFVAIQPDLADRPIILKLSEQNGDEHLCLARLHHAYIVPLYWVREFVDRRILALCMPYLGGLTLAGLLNALAPLPASQRRGKDILDALARQSMPVPPGIQPCGTLRQFLSKASLSQSVTWIGSCLADALQYAHERGLVHFDVKPANILVAADAQPMLLDFHLAQAPLDADGEIPERIGGTPAYMAPEQSLALDAVKNHRPLQIPVDHRADIYALGTVLYEALGGPMPRPPNASVRSLLRTKPGVTAGLADIIACCLAEKPDRRYIRAADVADDLRRHLANLPLRGVPNRSVRERWRKWRTRNPGSLTVAGLCVALAIFTIVVLRFGYDAIREPLAEAKSELVEARFQIAHRRDSDAIRTLRRAAARIQGVPWQGELLDSIQELLRQAQRNEAADRLHRLAEHLRFLCAIEARADDEFDRLGEDLRSCWNDRQLLCVRMSADADPMLADRIRCDLRDVVLIWSDLSLRSNRPGDDTGVRSEWVKRIREAEELLDSDRALAVEREFLESGKKERSRSESEGLDARRAGASQRFYRGRWLLRAGRLQAAIAALETEAEARPDDFWSHFYLGTCYYRSGDREAALARFQICVALRPTCAECYFNRGTAYDKAGRSEPAVRDFDRALELDPHFARAALNRGLIHYRARHFAEADADLKRALADGADPATACFNLALVAIARGDEPAARAYSLRARNEDPGNSRIRELCQSLGTSGNADPAR